MVDQKSEALGYSQGGFSTKIHLRAEGSGKPMVFFLSEGQRNEMVGFWPLMESGEVKKRAHRRGRPRLRPGRICADKGYAKGVVRRFLRRLGIRITIARGTNEHLGGPFDREIYRTRNLIRAAHQPPQALQAGGDALREVCGELPGDADARSDQDLAMICKQTLIRTWQNTSTSTRLGE
jgi:hypothetical protein